MRKSVFREENSRAGRAGFYPAAAVRDFHRYRHLHRAQKAIADLTRERSRCGIIEGSTVTPALLAAVRSMGAEELAYSTGQQNRSAVWEG